MPQVIAPPVGGIQLGPSIFVFFGAGSPNSQASVQVQTAAVGSLYMQTDGADTTHVLWVCTTSGVPASQGIPVVPSVWTNK